MGGGASTSKAGGSKAGGSPASTAPPSPPESAVGENSLTSHSGKAPAGFRRLARPATAVGQFIRFVTVNDVYQLDNYPRVASAIKEFKATSEEDGAMVFSLLPGDFLSPCTLTNLDGGVAMLKALNEVPIDYVMFGNHEFDLKTPQLQKRIKEYNGKWINSNVTFPEFEGKDGKPLPAYDIIKIGDRKVAVSAFLLDDMNQFAPVEPMPKILPPAESIVATWNKIKEVEGDIDAFVPMVHLNIKEDRALAASIAKHGEMSKITPLLLSAHDHEVYIEQAGKSLIFKVGADAENVGVIDLFWTADGKLSRSIHMMQAADFPEEPEVKKFVDKQLAMMDGLMNVDITQIPASLADKTLSTARVRFEAEPLVSWLLSVAKKSMPRVEIILLQGGNVRGGTPKYEPGPFKYGDLMKEIAFETEMCIVELPGSVIEASVRATRIDGDGPKPFFLHCCEEAVFAEGAGVTLEQIAGTPFEPERMYTVATYQFLLAGMGGIEPLSSYCKEHGSCPPLESCVPLKKYFMESCTRTAWLHLLGLDDDKEHSLEDTAAHSVELFDKIDTGKTSQVTLAELSTYLETIGQDTKLAAFLINSWDVDGDGMLSREEFLAITKEVIH